MAELQNILQKKRMTLCRAELHRRQEREASQNNCLGIRTSNSFLQDILRDLMRGQDLGENTALINPMPPTAEFNQKEQSLKEVEEVIKAARSGSTPGPSVQKGGITVAWSTQFQLHSSSEKPVKTEATLLFCDLANAYGSRPHKLVKLTLHHHSVPSKIQGC